MIYNSIFFIYNIYNWKASSKNPDNSIKKKKYRTIDKYWTRNLARFITKNNKCYLIYSANTLSHIENLKETETEQSLETSNDFVIR